MNPLDKLVDDFISEAIGKDVLELVQYLKKRENVSEFKLAEHFNLTVNQIRNMLYRLYAHSLVDFTRKKDKKKGWYIYYWDFYLKRALDAALAHKEKRLGILKELLKREETGQYFSCPDNDVRLGFEQAIEHGFKCPECDKILVQDNNSRKIQRLMKSIEELEGEIKTGKEAAIKRAEEIKIKEARRPIRKIKTKRKKVSQRKKAKTWAAKKSEARKKKSTAKGKSSKSKKAKKR
ncbi:hypothetical protein J4443_00630 [Candidatus Woesearchaeota archaeon]|nr:hypothetical protein [Candidatus Woesearchaeota archaeon]